MKKIRIPKKIWAAGAVALVAFTLAGQQTAPRVTPPSTPNAPPPTTSDDGIVTFSTGTEMVIVNVTVKDKNGKVAEDLKQNDFSIFEDGKKVTVQQFDFQKLSVDPEPPPPLTLADQLELPPVAQTTFVVEKPNEVTYHDKRLMPFFFDFSSMQVADQLRAQTAALEFLGKSVTKDTEVAILFYSSQIKVLQTFTTDRDLLTKIIRNLPIGEASELAGQADTGADDSEDTGAAFVADETEFNAFNSDQKIAALSDAAKLLGQFSEKKQLVYFTGGLSKSLDNQAQLDATVMALRKNNVTMYPLDARGLVADPPGGSASKGATRGAGAFNGSAVNSQRSSMNSSQETLVTLAKDTGGKAFIDSNDLETGLTRAQNDVQSYYILGYYTPNHLKDGKYRRIEVRMNNGMKASDYREGYYADRSLDKLSSADKEQRLREALTSNDPITDINMALQVDYFRISATQYFVPVSVKIPASAVELAQKGGAKTTQLDFIAAIQDDRHQSVQNVRDHIAVTLDSATAEKRKPFQYDAGFTLGPGKYIMKFVVQEDVTHKMGTYEKKFVVPDLSADTSGLKLSSVVWSSQRESLKAAVGTAEKSTKKEVTANPLIDGDEKIIPNVTRVFGRNQTLYVAFDVYDAKVDPEAKIRRVKVTASFFNKKGVKAFEIAPLDESEITNTRPEAIPVKIAVPLKQLAPGIYDAQINVVDEVGRKFAFPRTEIEIR